MKRLVVLFLVMLLCLTGCKKEETKTKEQILHETLVSSDTLKTKVERVAQLPTDGTIKMYPGMQGGWTDGTYYYQSRIKYDWNNQNNNQVIITKYDIAKQEVVQESQPLKLDHCNDITYNSKEGYFVVCHNTPNNRQISFLDPKTLEIIGTKKLDYGIWAIAYNETKDQYIIGISGEYTWKVLNANFELIAEYEGTERVEGFTKQSVDCDDNYVYFLYHSLPKIAVFDWEGNFITLLSFNIGGEPENISVADGVIYIGTAVGLYEVKEVYANK